jgi:hypothetical protein
MVKVLSSWPPPIFMPAPAAASTTSQAATTSHLRAKQARPIRYRTPDIWNVPSGQFLLASGSRRAARPLPVSYD